MSETMYRRTANPTLADLLQGGGGPDSFSPPSDTGLNDLLSKAFAPVDVGPAPETDKPKWGNRIAAAIGDALNTYARSQLPQLQPSNYQVEQRARKHQGDEEMNRYNRAKAISESESGRNKAQFLLNEQDRNLIRRDAQDASKELRQMSIDQQKESLRQAKELADQKATQDQAQFEAQKAWEKQLTGLKNKHDLAMENLRQKSSGGDKIAMEDRKSMGPVIGTIADLSLTAKQLLTDGKTTPEELNSIIQNEIDKAQLSPDGEAAVKAYYNKKFAGILREHSMSQDPQQGPSPSPPGPNPTSADYVKTRNAVTPLGRQ